MKLLILSFYYSPDLCAGSFRAMALVKALLDQLPEDAHIELITTLPNRYSSFSSEAPALEESSRLTVHRIKLPSHKSGMVDQAKAFIFYARQVLKIVRNSKYQMVYGTSSRLMTAALSSYIARKKNVPLYLDIRDIFVDTIKDVLPRRIAFLAKLFFSLVERWTIRQANKVNLVSEGFKDYFQTRYPKQRFSYFTNGIDDEFISSGEIGRLVEQDGQPLTALYAGNMGEGQGLHKIIPDLAKRLEGRVKFRLIGDGGRRAQLEQKLTEVGCTNVELLPPVVREQLLVEYQQADILFLHLNDYDAFRKVLPSKLFEYGATGKPIWAGLAGYSASFVTNEIDNCAVFYPCNAMEAERVLGELKNETVARSSFIMKFSRTNIMTDMATDILEIGC